MISPTQHSVYSANTVIDQLLQTHYSADLIMGSLPTDLTKIPSAFLLQDSISLVEVGKEMSKERF